MATLSANRAAVDSPNAPNPVTLTPELLKRAIAIEVKSGECQLWVWTPTLPPALPPGIPAGVVGYDFGGSSNDLYPDAPYLVTPVSEGIPIAFGSGFTAGEEVTWLKNGQPYTSEATTVDGAGGFLAFGDGLLTQGEVLTAQTPSCTTTAYWSATVDPTVLAPVLDGTPPVTAVTPPTTPQAPEPAEIDGPEADQGDGGLTTNEKLMLAVVGLVGGGAGVVAGTRLGGGGGAGSGDSFFDVHTEIDEGGESTPPDDHPPDPGAEAPADHTVRRGERQIGGDSIPTTSRTLGSGAGERGFNAQPEPPGEPFNPAPEQQGLPSSGAGERGFNAQPEPPGEPFNPAPGELEGGKA
jgi:hypothetical protein